MSVSHTAEYALRAVVQLAQGSSPSQTTQQIAQATQVPRSYLPKVLQPLTRAGIVLAQRGSHGGYSLHRDPTKLSVLEIVNCVDPFRHAERGRLDQEAPQATFDSLHRLLADSLAATEQRFAETMIASLVSAPFGIPQPSSPTPVAGDWPAADVSLSA